MPVIVKPDEWLPTSLPETSAPQLAVVIDTEEEFDWGAPFSRGNTGVSHMAGIHLVQEIFDDRGVIPTYVVDYAIASQPGGYGPLLDIEKDNRAEIGAHLHPWVTPPFDEPVDPFHSYPGNLDAPLERDKMRRLRDSIAEKFSNPPKVYRAGRYGLGASSLSTVAELGFEIDSSPSPSFDLTDDGGPDYSCFSNRPFWWREQGGLLCVPVTGAFVGRLPLAWKRRADKLFRRDGQVAKLLGILSRSGLSSRIRLTPEGYDLSDMQALTRYLQRQGERIFVLSFHSPTVQPGFTPYATTQIQRDKFLERLRNYFSFFFDELGGRATTLSTFRAELLAKRS